MKKTLQTFIFSCLMLSAISAQTHLLIGARAGLNVATYKFDQNTTPTSGGSSTNNNALLLTVGVPLEINFDQRFALQVELNFIQKGFLSKFELTTQGMAFKGDNAVIINWLEMPILAKARFGKKAGVGGGLFFGPSIGYGLSGKNKGSFVTTQNGTSTTTTNEQKVDFKQDDHSRLDIGLNLGGEINYWGLFLDARYQFGLTNMAIDADIKVQTRGLALTLGYRIPIGLAAKVPAKTKKK